MRSPQQRESYFWFLDSFQRVLTQFSLVSTVPDRYRSINALKKIFTQILKARNFKRR
ncbi:hypothetical protein CKA32_004764 [Geitlerinema sp. FC II]|nr:hypothetical protein CKA32_004764 [Geitlerinema sp. FC II]